MRAVQAVSFDLDDTLRDASGAAGALRRTAEQVAAISGVASEVLLEANAREWAALWPEVEAAWTLGAMSGEDVTREAWRRTLAACGVDGAELADGAAQMHLAEILAAQRLFDDAAGLLDALGGRVPLALITNGASDTQRAVLRALDLEPRFDSIVISGEVGVAKPDPAAFRRVSDEVGADPAATWHVGDNLVTDVGGAKAAGLVAVWLNRGGATRGTGLAEPHLEVRSLDDLLPHITSFRDVAHGPTND